MTFNSFDFLLFFPIVVLIYCIVPKKLKSIWLLIASYYFYMSWSVSYVFLILISTLSTYVCGIALEKAEKKKAVLLVNIVINLGILFVFKYFNFFADTLNSGLGLLKISPINIGINIMVPVGISFYTFQAIGYTLDVYRGNIEAERSFIKYALFVSFFPQLVAGPIERSGRLLSQIKDIENKKMMSFDGFVSGFSLMCYGMFIKMVVADRLALFVDSVWGNLQLVGTTEAILAMIAFSFQIYCDFNGYSLIAIGAARLMGFDLMENFNTPYLAVSISDFWRRWHISLSTWFRDYLYIPMGGSRCSKAKKYRNIMVTFLVSGLWHGANWTYVIWGGLHGLYQIVGDSLLPIRKKISQKLGVNEEVESYRIGKIFGTFVLVSFAWIFFKAESVSQAFTFIKGLILRPNPWMLFSEDLYTLGLNHLEFNILIFALLVVFVADFIRYFKKMDFGAFMLKQNFCFRMIVLVTLIISCLVFGEYGIHFEAAKFIYFQF